METLTIASEDHDHPSPKRKRSDSTTPAAQSSFAPQLNLDGDVPHLSRFTHRSPEPDSSHPLHVPNSPRSCVAAQLSNLKLRDVDQKASDSSMPVLEFGVRDTTPKRARRVSALENVDVHGQHPIELHRSRLVALEPDELEIPETPQSVALNHQKPRSSFVGPVNFASSLEGRNRSSSPSPASLRAQTSTPPIPLSELVWKDSEITGHLMVDPDDDGTGINGIGFKPTPAIAYAREQRRKQQIHEWKLREAKEARQKRSERRRGAAALAEKQAVRDSVKRMVRFTDALKG